MNDDRPIYRPRLVVDITDEQAQKLNRYLEYGMRGPVFSVIIDDVISMLEKHGAVFLGAVLARHLKLEDYSTLQMEKPHGKSRKPGKKVDQSDD